MNQSQKREVLATLIKAGRKDLARQFARQVTAAAPALTIVNDMMKEWPRLEKLAAEGDLPGARKLLEKWQHAYFYAPGMNERVLRLSDSNAAFELSNIIRHMSQPGYDAESLNKDLQSYGKRVMDEWKDVAKKYAWQKGMTAEQIQREFDQAYRNADAKGGGRLAKRVMDIFFSKGPDAARKAIEKSKAKKVT